MEQQLSAHKLEFMRIAAVNGAIHAQQDPYCSDTLRSHLGAAEIGCLLSHFKTWRLIAEADSEYGLVLEDDIHLSDDFNAIIHSMCLDPKEFCIHKLETFGANVTLNRRPRYTAGGRSAFQLRTNHGGSGAYIVSKDTASRLLQYLELFHEAMDIELFDPNRRTVKDLIVYQWVPAPCIQDFLLDDSKSKMSFASNIGMDRADVKTYSLDRSQTYADFIKSRLRGVYTKLYSFSLLLSGQRRRTIEFK